MKNSVRENVEWTELVHVGSVDKFFWHCDEYFGSVKEENCLISWISSIPTAGESRVAQLVQGLAYGLDDWASITGNGRDFFSSPPRPDRLRNPPSLLSSGYQKLFPQGYSGRTV
jgi:hypothetical protein